MDKHGFPGQTRAALPWWKLALACLVGMLLVTLVTAQEPEVAVQRIAVSTASEHGYVISPNGARVAYVERDGAKQVVVVDGERQRPYDHIRAPWMLYDADIGDTSHFQAPQQALDDGLVFSPDGTRLACVIGQWEKPGPILWRQARVAVVVDGKAGPFYDEVSLPTFNADGAHLAYVARKGKQWMAVLDGKEGKPYDAIESRESRVKVRIGWNVFARNGSRMACAGLRDNIWHVIVDGEEGPGYQNVADLTFSPDGRRFVYSAVRDRKTFLVLDGKEIPASDGAIRPMFSPDGRRLVYLVQEGQSQCVILDGKKGAAYQWIRDPIFSPDGLRLAYVAITGGKSSQFVLVLDGREVPLPPHNQIYGVQFSPDGRRLAVNFGDQNGGGGLLIGRQVVRGARGLNFSPDSAHVIYIKGTGVCRDYEPVRMPAKSLPLEARFTPDGRHLIILCATSDHKARFISVDGQPGTPCDEIVTIDPRDPGREQQFVFFDASDRFHYFAVKDGTLQRVSVAIPRQSHYRTDTSGMDRRIALHLEPLPGNETVTAGEPVLMTLRAKNVSDETVELCNWCSNSTLRMEVLDGHDRIVAETATPPRPLDELVSVKRLKPGESLRATLVLSSLHAFNEPDTYLIRAHRHGPYDVTDYQTSTETVLHVESFDAARLQARCDELWSLLRDGRVIDPHRMALCSVRHNLALPALEWMAREWNDRYACLAIRRIDTPEARQSLERLTAAGGKTAKAVEDSARLLSEPDEWACVAGLTVHISPAATVLSWIDEETGAPLFTVKDIVRFDWGRQVFELTADASKRMQALPRRQHRYFLLTDEEGVIYRGTLYNPSSSQGFHGPAITIGWYGEDYIRPPLYRIQAWYGGAYLPAKGDLRYQRRLWEDLKAAGVLGNIRPKPNTVPNHSVPGEPCSGVTVDVRFTKATYRAGEPVEFTIRERTVIDCTMTVFYGDFPHYYLLALTDADGKPVAKTAEAEKREGKPQIAQTGYQTPVPLQPWQEHACTYDLRDYVKALPLGTYRVQIKRPEMGIYSGTTAPTMPGEGALSFPCRITIK